jgi:hypothetical protein
LLCVSQANGDSELHAQADSHAEVCADGKASADARTAPEYCSIKAVVEDLVATRRCNGAS